MFCSFMNVNLGVRPLNVVRIISVDRFHDEYKVTVDVVDERVLHVQNASGAVDAEASFFYKALYSLL